MRRLTAILLFAAFVLPFALPLLALGQDADAALPICCRRSGAHHCAMTMAERSQSGATDSRGPQSQRWQAPAERCPFYPASIVSYHPLAVIAPGAHSVLGDFFSHPTGPAQTASKRRISRDRSRQKRGPPAVSLA